MQASLYPNLYVVLVGNPGVGKTIITSRVEAFWTHLQSIGEHSQHHHVASADVTAASLIDELAAADRKIIRPTEVPSIVQFNSLLIASNELSSLIPAYENNLMAVLTNIWDGNPYAQRRRTKDIEINMPNPQLNMLAATTPDYLNNVMPEGAWGQGFIARVMLIYSGEVILRPPFDDNPDKSREVLKHDLKLIGDLYGKMSFDPDAAEAITHWHMRGGDPKPDHPRLVNYNIRRLSQLIKLCMVASVSEVDDLNITIEHYRTALAWLLEAEQFMPDLFKSMRTGGDVRVIEEVWHFAYQIWIKEKRPVLATRIYNFISERTPAHNVGRILDVMVRSGLLEERLEREGKSYLPKVRTAGPA